MHGGKVERFELELELEGCGGNECGEGLDGGFGLGSVSWGELGCDGAGRGGGDWRW